MPATVLPDVNVLVAAHRGDHPQHKPASDWLTRTLSGTGDGQMLVLPMAVISGFLRLVTNSRIFPMPSDPQKAVDFVDWLLESPLCRLLGDSSEWIGFRGLVLDKNLMANQVPDAWLAALAISTGEPFVTFDKGFRRLLPPSLLVLLQPA
jgi:uncharacterized protein